MIVLVLRPSSQHGASMVSDSPHKLASAPVRSLIFFSVGAHFFCSPSLST
jgi:hypothetical protein